MLRALGVLLIVLLVIVIIAGLGSANNLTGNRDSAAKNTLTPTPTATAVVEGDAGEVVITDTIERNTGRRDTVASAAHIDANCTDYRLNASQPMNLTRVYVEGTTRVCEYTQIVMALPTAYPTQQPPTTAPSATPMPEMQNMAQANGYIYGSVGETNTFTVVVSQGQVGYGSGSSINGENDGVVYVFERGSHTVNISNGEIVLMSLADGLARYCSDRTQYAQYVAHWHVPSGWSCSDAAVNPTPVPAQSTQVSVTGLTANANLPMTGDLFHTPVQSTESFNPQSAWLISEPGRLLDNTAAFVIPSVESPHFANCPEGGFFYASLGSGDIEVDGVVLHLEAEAGTNHLVVIRCRIDDAIVDSDLNLQLRITNFVAGMAIWSHMQPGAYVSRDWFEQQLRVSGSIYVANDSMDNCGATGCSKTYVHLYDASSRFYQMWRVNANNVLNWTLVATNGNL